MDPKYLPISPELEAALRKIVREEITEALQRAIPEPAPPPKPRSAREEAVASVARAAVESEAMLHAWGDLTDEERHIGDLIFNHRYTLEQLAAALGTDLTGARDLRRGVAKKLIDRFESNKLALSSSANILSDAAKPEGDMDVAAVTPEKRRGRPRVGETILARWIDSRKDWDRAKMADTMGISLTHINDLCSGRRVPSRLIAKFIQLLTAGQVKVEDWPNLSE